MIKKNDVVVDYKRRILHVEGVHRTELRLSSWQGFTALRSGLPFQCPQWENTLFSLDILPFILYITIMTYTKLESKLNTIDRAVRKHYLHNDTEAIIRLAWRMGYDGDFYFSNDSRKLISKLGITEATSQAYLDGQNDQLIY